MTTKKNIRLPKSKGIETATVYTPDECLKKIKHIVLQENNQQIVEEFITIQNMKQKFEEAEVSIPNKIVMFGPPGTGKTLTAYYLASRLELPLIVVRLDAIIHSHLGETGSNIRKIFEFAKLAPCVLFLDEFDAIARARDSIDEVKEMARVVNTLLQCLDEFHSNSTFIAATNLEEELDTAVWRRFDTRMTYELPGRAELDVFLTKLLGVSHENRKLIEQSKELLLGCSFADIEQIILKAKRKMIIEDSEVSYDKIAHGYAAYNPRTLPRDAAPAGAIS
ncbi:AAA+ superfamily predicted ATPase [Paenibacillus sp. V4I9]|uniref:AAA family ATPase n=1 Tax=Paenibacillus sp. V4I9 TaxID=3042308 RepID=UPI002784FC0D|nr:AAA family ATPase [Paenibacillus sp. V4I9]MDQ0885735.1 AAA+ superfamily predicted ATPase [Paenibacillus sp. V4I9]